MPVTYKKIATVTVTGATAASIDFTSIPGTFTDLEIKLSARTSVADTEGKITFNGVTTGYSIRRLWGNGASVGSDTLYGYLMSNSSGYTASTFSSNSIYIPNYAGSTNKSISTDGVTETNATNNAMVISASLWSNTAAITSIKLEPLSGAFVQYSTAVLYGISKS